MDELLRKHQDFMRHLANAAEALHDLGADEDVQLLKEIETQLNEI